MTHFLVHTKHTLSFIVMTSLLDSWHRMKMQIGKMGQHIARAPPSIFCPFQKRLQ
jgi:hypothetical protein